jgi:hypothetical protein
VIPRNPVVPVIPIGFGRSLKWSTCSRPGNQQPDDQSLSLILPATRGTTIKFLESIPALAASVISLDPSSGVKLQSTFLAGCFFKSSTWVCKLVSATCTPLKSPRNRSKSTRRVDISLVRAASASFIWRARPWRILASFPYRREWRTHHPERLRL